MQNKKLKLSAQVYIALSALSLLYVSMMAFVSPQAVMDLVQVNLTNNDAISSIRGVYGGVGLTLFISLVWLMLKDVPKGLGFLCLLWSLYALSRVITIISDGTLGAFGRQWLLTESLLFAIGAVLFIKVNTSTHHSTTPYETGK